MKPVDILREAREVISDPKCWTKGSFAKTWYGANIGSDSPNAVAWCSIGAIRKVCRDEEYVQEATVELERTTDSMFPEFQCVPEFNDSGNTSHADVMAAFDKTIMRLEEIVE